MKYSTAIFFAAILSLSFSIAAGDLTTGLQIDVRNNQTSNSTDIRDWSTNQINFSLTNGATYNSTYQYTYQSGNDDYLRSPSTTLIDIGSSADTNGTIIAWYYIPGDVGTNVDLYTLGAGNNSIYCYSQLSSSNAIRCDIKNSTGSDGFESTGLDTPIGQWFMLALTINSAGLTQSYLGNESGTLISGNTWTPTGGKYRNPGSFPILFGSAGTNSPVGGGLGRFTIYNTTKNTVDLNAFLQMGHSGNNETITVVSNLSTTIGTSRLAEAPNIQTGWPLSNQTTQANNYTARVDCNNDGNEDCNVTNANAAIARALALNLSTDSYGVFRGQMSLESVYPTSATPNGCSQSDFASPCMQRAANKWAYDNGYKIKWGVNFMPPWLANTTNGLCTASGSNRSCAPKSYETFADLVYNHSLLIGCVEYAGVCEFEMWNEPDLRGGSAFLYNNLSSVGSSSYRGNLTKLHTSFYDRFSVGDPVLSEATMWISPMADVFDANASTARRNLMADLQSAGYNDNFKVSFHFYNGAWSNSGRFSTLLDSAYDAVLADCVTYSFDCTDISVSEWGTYYAGNQNASVGSYNYSINQVMFANALYFFVTDQRAYNYPNVYQFVQWSNYSSVSSEYPRQMSEVNHPQLNQNLNLYLSPYDAVHRYTTYHAFGSTIYSCSNGDSYIDCLVTKRLDGKYFLTINNNGDLDRVVRVSFNGLTVTSANSTRNTTTYSAVGGLVTLTSINGMSSNTYELDVSDSTAPVVTVTSPVSGTYTTSSVTVNFNATEETSVINTLWYFNGSANVTYTNPVVLTLVDGSYSFVFYANDSSGNVGSSTVSFSVNTVVPTPSESICTNSGEGISELASWLPIIGLVVGAAVVMGVIYLFQNGGLSGGISLDVGGMELGTIAIVLVGAAITISIAARIIVSALC